MKRDKRYKEIRKYLNHLLEHLGHHCCAINTERHNEILDLLYDLESENK